MYLKHAQTTYISLELGKITQHNEIQCTESVVYPCDHVPDWELWLLAAAQHRKRSLLPNTSSRKDQNAMHSFH